MSKQDIVVAATSSVWERICNWEPAQWLAVWGTQPNFPHNIQRLLLAQSWEEGIWGRPLGFGRSSLEASEG